MTTEKKTFEEWANEPWQPPVKPVRKTPVATLPPKTFKEWANEPFVEPVVEPKRQPYQPLPLAAPAGLLQPTVETPEASPEGTMNRQVAQEQGESHYWIPETKSWQFVDVSPEESIKASGIEKSFAEKYQETEQQIIKHPVTQAISLISGVALIGYGGYAAWQMFGSRITQPIANMFANRNYQKTAEFQALRSLAQAARKKPTDPGFKPLNEELRRAFDLQKAGKTKAAQEIVDRVRDAYSRFMPGVLRGRELAIRQPGAPPPPQPKPPVVPVAPKVTPKPATVPAVRPTVAKPAVVPPTVAPVVVPPATAAVPEVTPRVTPPTVEKPVVPTEKPAPNLVARKQEITKVLATPIKELPKGTSKIVLRQELAKINAKLVPTEKKLRQQIMAQVRDIGLPESQSRSMFLAQGGSRYLSSITMERLPKVLEAVGRARPVSIKGKRVVTPKTEALIQSSKQDLIDEGILTEETYKGVLQSLKLKTDKYVGKDLFISQTEGNSIIREMRNKAILFPLGPLEFGKPTAVKYLTSQTYYAQVLGVKPLTEPLELAKVDLELAQRAMYGSIDRQISEVNKAWGVSVGEKLAAKTEARPTKAVSTLRDLLDKHEEAPEGLTPAQTKAFNWFRNLNRTIIDGENKVRQALGMPEITYREAYVRHVPDKMAEAILRGEHPIPPSLEYWSQKLVSKTVFNPTAMHRQLSDDLAKLYTKDLARATKDMVRIGLREINLAQPLKALKEQMGALKNVMPASTQKWVIDYVNQELKGQQTEWDANLNRIVTESGVGGLIDSVLKPYNLTLGTRPITQLAQVIGHGTILAVLALPRPRLARLMIRNAFQRVQDLALHGIIPVLKSFLPDPPELKALKAKSSFLKSYTGIEEWPVDLMGKVGKVALAPYQFTAVLNADRSFSINYHDYLSLFTNPKYKAFGWASPRRTYKEAKNFLYPEEQTTMIKEAELGARATQYHYIGMAMPEIFRNKTLIPLTRLQSWWMNHIFVFHREASRRFLYGETRWGGKLPWTKRVNYLQYLLLGGAILTAMGYGMSYLWKVLPYNLSPVAQFMTGLLTYVSAGSDWQREEGKREIYGSWKAMVPGALAYDEFEKLWSGDMPLWQMFFYGGEEEGPPPRPPTWGIINREPAINRNAAKRDITEAEGKLGQTVPREVPEPYHYIDDNGERQLYTPVEEDYVYTTTDLGAAINRATTKIDDGDITSENEFSPLTLFYKEAEGMWGHYYYSIPTQPASLRTDFRETPEGAYIEAYLFFWGKVTVLRNDSSRSIVGGWMAEYGVPETAIPSLEKVGESQKEKAAQAEAQRWLRQNQ